MKVRSYVQLGDGKVGVWETANVNSIQEAIDAVNHDCMTFSYNVARILNTILPEEAQT